MNKFKSKVICVLMTFLVSSLFLYGDPVQEKIAKSTTGGGMKKLIVISPKAGVKWGKGLYRYIEWRPDGYDGPFKLVLLKNNQEKGTIAESINPASLTPNKRYKWKVGEITTGSVSLDVGYQVKVIFLNINKSYKSGLFEITKPVFKPGPGFVEKTIKITQPTQQSSWKKGSKQYIKWETVLNPPFKIDLMNPEGTKPVLGLGEIHDSSSNNKYTKKWTIPLTLQAGEYRVQISVFNGKVKKLSQKFMIAGTIKKEYWVRGTMENKRKMKRIYDKAGEYGIQCVPSMDDPGPKCFRVGFEHRWDSSLPFYCGQLYRSRAYFNVDHLKGKGVVLSARLKYKKMECKEFDPKFYFIEALGPNLFETTGILLTNLNKLPMINIAKWFAPGDYNHGILITAGKFEVFTKTNSKCIMKGVEVWMVFEILEVVK